MYTPDFTFCFDPSPAVALRRAASNSEAWKDAASPSPHVNIVTGYKTLLPSAVGACILIGQKVSTRFPRQRL